MGASVATAVADDVANISMNVVNTYNQQCNSSTVQNQILDISGCTNVIIDGINNKQKTVIAVKCLQSDATQTNIDTTVLQGAQQAAQAVTQNFGMPSAGVANTIASQITDLAIKVSNTYISMCAVQIGQGQTLKCKDSTNIIISNVNQEQTTSQLSNCVLNATTVSAAKAALTQTVSQSAVAKEENALTALVIAAAIALVIVLVVVSR